MYHYVRYYDPVLYHWCETGRLTQDEAVTEAERLRDAGHHYVTVEFDDCLEEL